MDSLKLMFFIMLFSTVSIAVPWADTDFSRRELLQLVENGGVNHTNAVYYYQMNKDKNSYGSCVNETRVYSNETGSNVEIPFQIYNEDATGANRTCDIYFLINVTANSYTQDYQIYWNNPIAAVPSYTSDLDCRENSDEQILFDNVVMDAVYSQKGTASNDPNSLIEWGKTGTNILRAAIDWGSVNYYKHATGDYWMNVESDAASWTENGSIFCEVSLNYPNRGVLFMRLYSRDYIRFHHDGLFNMSEQNYVFNDATKSEGDANLGMINWTDGSDYYAMVIRSDNTTNNFTYSTGGSPVYDRWVPQTGNVTDVFSYLWYSTSDSYRDDFYKRIDLPPTATLLASESLLPYTYNEIYDYIVYETNLTELILSVVNNTSVVDMNATLYWNGSAYTPSKTLGLNYTWNFSLTVPLVDTNNTTIEHYWTVETAHSSWSEMHNTSPVEQDVLHAYGIVDSTSSTTTLEGDRFITTSNIFDLIYAATLSMNLTFNGTNYPMTRINTTAFQHNITIPDIADSQSTTIDYNFTFLITNNSTVRTETTATTTLTIYRVILTNCSVGAVVDGVPAINFSFRDEETNEFIQNVTADLVFTGSYSNFNFTFDNINQNFQICIWPNWSSALFDLDMEYDHEDYTLRNHYLVDENLSNASFNTTLYLVNGTDATSVKITVIDAFEEGLEDVDIQTWRFYTASGWVYMSSTTTNEEGYSYEELILDTVIYRFLIYNGTELIYTSSPMYVYETELEFQVAETIPIILEQIQHLISVNCTNISNTTGACTLIDDSGEIDTWYMDVKQINTYSNVTRCANASVAVNNTLSCFLDTDTSGQLYMYEVYVDVDTELYWLDGGFWDFGTHVDWGVIGIFIGALLLFLMIIVSMRMGIGAGFFGVILGIIIISDLGLGIVEMGIEIVGYIIAGGAILAFLATKRSDTR